MTDNPATREQLLAFLTSRLVTHPEGPLPYLGVQRPVSIGLRKADGGVRWYDDAEALADAVLDEAGFRSIELGTWLNTPDGRLISDVVGQVLPPGYRPEYHLVVEALRIAAGHQREAGIQRAVGAGAVAVIAFFLWMLRER